MNSFLETSQYADLMGIAIGFFCILSVIMHLLATNKRTSGNRLLYLIGANMILKIVASFIIIYLYLDYKDPESKLAILPFLSTYLVFTGFETYSLSRLAESG